MLREFGQGVLLFCLPFAVYAGLLLARVRMPFMREAWSSPRFAILVALGLGCVILGLIGLGTLGARHQGAYQPAHLEDGRLVPGRME